MPEVKAVDPYHCPWNLNVGGPAPTELYSMSPAFLSADIEGVKPHHVHKDLLRVIRGVFLAMIRDGELPRAGRSA